MPFKSTVNIGKGKLQASKIKWEEVKQIRENWRRSWGQPMSRSGHFRMRAADNTTHTRYRDPLPGIDWKSNYLNHIELTESEYRMNFCRWGWWLLFEAAFAFLPDWSILRMMMKDNWNRILLLKWCGLAQDLSHTSLRGIDYFEFAWMWFWRSISYNQYS